MLDSPADFPPPPWILHGAALVLHTGCKAVAFVHYHQSPVGSYKEIAVVTLTLRGPRVIAMPVTSAVSMHAGRLIWGFPKSRRAMDWQERRGHDHRVLFDGGAYLYRFRIARFGVRLALRGWTIQTHQGRDVRVPLRFRARFHFAWSGRKWALYADDFEMIVEPPQPL